MAKRKQIARPKVNAALRKIQRIEDRRMQAEAQAREKAEAERNERIARERRLLGKWPRVDGKFSWIAWRDSIAEFCNAVRHERIEAHLAGRIRELLKLETMVFSPSNEDMLSLLYAGFVGKDAGIESRLGELAEDNRQGWADSFQSNKSSWLYTILYHDIEGSKAWAAAEATAKASAALLDAANNRQEQTATASGDGLGGVQLSSPFSAQDWGGFFFGSNSKKAARRFNDQRANGDIRARKIGRLFRVPIEDLPPGHPEAVPKR